MALNRIPTKSMVSLTRTLVDPQHDDHRALMTQPMLAACMPELERAHTQVLRVREAADIRNLLQELIDAQRVVDDRHDDWVRGIWYRLVAEEYMAKTPEDAAMFRKLRTWLFPEGLATVNLSYREEIGHADMVRERMTPEREALLARLGTHDGNMLDEVRTWLALADELGQLEHQRAGVEVSGAGRGINLEARNAWVRIVDHMRRAAHFAERDPEQADDPALATIAEVMGRIERAERLADIRAQRRANPGDPGPDVTDDVPDDVTDNLPDADIPDADIPDANISHDAPANPLAETSLGSRASESWSDVTPRQAPRPEPTRGEAGEVDERSVGSGRDSDRSLVRGQGLGRARERVG